MARFKKNSKEEYNQSTRTGRTKRSRADVFPNLPFLRSRLTGGSKHVVCIGYMELYCF